MTLAPEQIEQFIADGYVVAPGLIPRATAEQTRCAILQSLGSRDDDPASWDRGQAVLGALTEPTVVCRNEAVEDVARQLVGPHFVRGVCRSPYRESAGIEPWEMPGFIPVLNYPVPGEKRFEALHGFHIDGMHLAGLWPRHLYLVVFAYLNDTPDYGGATAIRPGSHRQVFEHWMSSGGDHQGDATPQLDYAPPIPMAGGAGDVIFMHYLTVHAGSTNTSERIRVGLNTGIMPDPSHPYVRKCGAPARDWTALDWTLRTDNLT